MESARTKRALNALGDRNRRNINLPASLNLGSVSKPQLTVRLKGHSVPAIGPGPPIQDAHPAKQPQCTPTFLA